MNKSNISWSIINVLLILGFYEIYNASGNILAAERMLILIIVFFSWLTPERYRYLDRIYKRKKENAAIEK